MIDTQLQEIIAKTCQELKILYADRLDRIILYGSQARGDAKPGSDIDNLYLIHLRKAIAWAVPLCVKTT